MYFWEKFVVFIVAVFGVAFLYSIGWLIAADILPVAQYTITISEKEFADSTYLVWDENGNVFEVEDSLVAGRFNSSNDYFKLKLGSTYNVITRGRRAPFWSLYPNIIEFVLVDE